MTYTVATKEQERNALSQINAIIASLGQGSYLSFAFEGCTEIAESNIDNDFADSPLARLEIARTETMEALERCEGWKRRYHHTLNKWEKCDAELRLVKNMYADLEGSLQYRIDHNTETQKVLDDTRQELDEAKQEIIRLKAMLFDFMEKVG